MPPPARRAWYRRLHRQLCSCDLVVCTHRAVSVVLGVGHAAGGADRHAVLNWLMSEPDVWAVQFGELALWLDTALAGRAAGRRPLAQWWVASGVPPGWPGDTPPDGRLRHAVLAVLLARHARQAQLRLRLAPAAAATVPRSAA